MCVHGRGSQKRTKDNEWKEKGRERERVEREKKNGEARSGKVDNHAFNDETKARANTFHGREERRGEEKVKDSRKQIFRK